MGASVHIFECGDGDTILIEGGGFWGMVDANFVPKRGVRSRVEGILENVDRLRFVCVTHFDLDHLRGLVAFLDDNFVDRTPGGDVVWRIDEIIVPLSETTLRVIGRLKNRTAWYIKRMPDSPSRVGDFAKEVYLLFDFLWEMLTYSSGNRPKISSPGPGKVLYYPSNRGGSSSFGDWVILSLGPSEETSEIYSRQIEEEVAGRRRLKGLFRKIEKNKSSRILALVNKALNQSILLCGDATPDEIVKALNQWDAANALRGVEGPVPFKVVKISHHGALSCHCEAIYDQYSTKDSLGLISALDNNDHPDGVVIAKLHDVGMDHRITGVDSEGELILRHGVPLGTTVTELDGDITYDFQRDNVSGGKRSRK